MATNACGERLRTAAAAAAMVAFGLAVEGVIALAVSIVYGVAGGALLSAVFAPLRVLAMLATASVIAASVPQW